MCENADWILKARPLLLSDSTLVDCASRVVKSIYLNNELKQYICSIHPNEIGGLRDK